MAEPVQRNIPLELGVAALVVASAVPLSRLVRGEGYDWLVASTLALSLGLAWLLRRLQLPAPLSLGLSLLAFVWYACIVFVPSTLWGPFPWADSLRGLGELVRSGGEAVMTDVAPVALSGGIRLFVAAGVWVSTALIDLTLIRARSPLLAVAFGVPMFALPGTLIVSRRRGVEMFLFLAAAALALFLDERSRTQTWGAIAGKRRPGWRAGPAVRLMLAAGLIAIILMPLMPGYGRPPGLQGIGETGDRIVFNPLVAIKPTLQNTPERTLFIADTSKSLYYRLTSLEAFDGKTWHQGTTRRTERIGIDRGAPTSPGGFDEIAQRIRIQALAGAWLPAAYEPLAVDNAFGDTMIEQDSRALIFDGDGGLPRGLSYTVISAVPSVTQTLLDQPFAFDEVALEDYLRLPQDVRTQLRPLADRIVTGAQTPYDKAVALQRHLRGFTYDDKVAAGHSFSTITEFLTVTKRGYCEQFAGTMAVLARTLDIPSRVVIGFAGGKRVGPGQYHVTTEYAHAWVEIFFPTSGWIAFEPTPRSGIARVPEYTQQIEPLDPSGAPSPSATDATASPSPSSSARGPAGALDDETDSGAGGGVPVPAWSIPLLALGLVVVLAIGAVLIQVLRRRSGRRHAGAGRDQVAYRYVDFLGWCAAAGFGRHAGETPIEHAARLGGAVAPAAGPLARVAELATEALWAPPNGLDPSDAGPAVAEARAALEAALSRRSRVLAAAGWGRWRSAE